MAKTLISLSFFLLMILTMVALHVSQPVPPAPAPPPLVPTPAPAVSPASPVLVPAPAHTGPVVPAVFVFGDSTLDVGTNNFLPESEAKADMLYNGIDYHSSASTGRFSNGYNTADFIAKSLGYTESPPAFLFILYMHIDYLRSIQNFRGVNFASGGAGLLDDTGKVPYKKVIPMGEQVQQFATVHGNLSQALGGAPETIISKSFFLISVGSNDIFEYFDLNSTQTQQDFFTSLMDNYRTHLKNLLDLGATKLGIISVPAIGCCPYQRTFNKTGGCREALNAFAQVFHEELESLLQNLTSDYPSMKYSLGNAYEMTTSFLHIPDFQRSYFVSFAEIQAACCGNGTLNAESPCRPNSHLCPDREVYFFWDQYHPTQNVSRIFALLLSIGPLNYISPMNFSQLAALDS